MGAAPRLLAPPGRLLTGTAMDTAVPRDAGGLAVMGWGRNGAPAGYSRDFFGPPEGRRVTSYRVTPPFRGGRLGPRVKHG